jgi:hypothetical protein
MPLEKGGRVEIETDQESKKMPGMNHHFAVAPEKVLRVIGPLPTEKAGGENLGPPLRPGGMGENEEPLAGGQGVEDEEKIVLPVTGREARGGQLEVTVEKVHSQLRAGEAFPA